MSIRDYIAQTEHIKNIKRLLEDSGYLYNTLIPSDLDKINNEELFMIEYDIKTFLNSNNCNLSSIWCKKYKEKLYYNHIDGLIDEFLNIKNK